MRKINMDNLRRYYTQAITRLQDGKLKITKSLGGKNKMETKSRYEVIAELEDKKRSLIKERDSFYSFASLNDILFLIEYQFMNS